LCSICPKGKYQPNVTFDGECLDCVGSYILDDGQDVTQHDSFEDCQNCAAGKEFADTITECIVCSYSKYQDQSNVAGLACKTCSSNTYITDDRKLVDAHTAQGDCVACKEGKFAAAGDRACDACTAGKESINSACVNCISGKYSTSEVPTCEFCPKGFVQATPGTPYCLPCLRKYNFFSFFL